MVDVQKRIAQLEKDQDFQLELVILEVLEDFARAMDDQSLTYVEVARRMGATKSLVTRIMNGPDNLTLRTIVRVANALNLRVSLTAQSGRNDVNRAAWRESKINLRLSRITEGCPVIDIEEWRQNRQEFSGRVQPIPLTSGKKVAAS